MLAAIAILVLQFIFHAMAILYYLRHCIPTIAVVIILLLIAC